jgi:hypothetical protein
LLAFNILFLLISILFERIILTEFNVQQTILNLFIKKQTILDLLPVRCTGVITSNSRVISNNLLQSTYKHHKFFHALHSSVTFHVKKTFS